MITAAGACTLGSGRGGLVGCGIGWLWVILRGLCDYLFVFPTNGRFVIRFACWLNMDKSSKGKSRTYQSEPMVVVENHAGRL